jgi:hypothetical protein
MKKAMAPRVLFAALMAMWLLVTQMPAEGTGALFTRTKTLGSNSISTDVLAAPTGLLGSGGLSISLNWTPTADTYAAGYRIYRSTTPAGVQTLAGSVLGQGSVSFLDSLPLGTYYYTVRAYFQNWESANSNQIMCIQAITVFVC